MQLELVTMNSPYKIIPVTTYNQDKEFNNRNTTDVGKLIHCFTCLEVLLQFSEVVFLQHILCVDSRPVGDVQDL